MDNQVGPGWGQVPCSHSTACCLFFQSGLHMPTPLAEVSFLRCEADSVQLCLLSPGWVTSRCCLICRLLLSCTALAQNWRVGSFHVNFESSGFTWQVRTSSPHLQLVPLQVPQLTVRLRPSKSTVTVTPLYHDQV